MTRLDGMIQQSDNASNTVAQITNKAAIAETKLE